VFKPDEHGDFHFQLPPFDGEQEEEEEEEEEEKDEKEGE
jgi:hypothetical protein